MLRKNQYYLSVKQTGLLKYSPHIKTGEFYDLDQLTFQPVLNSTLQPDRV